MCYVCVCINFDDVMGWVGKRCLGHDTGWCFRQDLMMLFMMFDYFGRQSFYVVVIYPRAFTSY